MQQVKKEEIVIGQVVRLKSGGPRMTVYGLNGSSATCVWMVHDLVQQGEFSMECLVTANK